MPRKKMKNPDRIKNIFIEKPERKANPNVTDSLERGLEASEPTMPLKKHAMQILKMDEGQTKEV